MACSPGRRQKCGRISGFCAQRRGATRRPESTPRKQASVLARSKRLDPGDPMGPRNRFTALGKQRHLREVQSGRQDLNRRPPGPSRKVLAVLDGIQRGRAVLVGLSWAELRSLWTPGLDPVARGRSLPPRRNATHQEHVMPTPARVLPTRDRSTYANASSRR